LIPTSFGVPNFPAYPSNYAAISAGMARIIADQFPTERARLDALAEEAALCPASGRTVQQFTPRAAPASD
jgi:hypothetical protein